MCTWGKSAVFYAQSPLICISCSCYFCMDFWKRHLCKRLLRWVMSDLLKERWGFTFRQLEISSGKRYTVLPFFSLPPPPFDNYSEWNWTPIIKKKNVAATVFNRKPKNEFCYMSTYKYWRNFSWVNEADIVKGGYRIKTGLWQGYFQQWWESVLFFSCFFFICFFFNPPQTSCGLPSNVMSEKVPQAPYNKKQK